MCCRGKGGYRSTTIAMGSGSSRGSRCTWPLVLSSSSRSEGNRPLPLTSSRSLQKKSR